MARRFDPQRASLQDVNVAQAFALVETGGMTQRAGLEYAGPKLEAFQQLHQPVMHR